MWILNRVVEILSKVGVKFGSVNVLESEEMREELNNTQTGLLYLSCM